MANNEPYCWRQVSGEGEGEECGLLIRWLQLLDNATTLQRLDMHVCDTAMRVIFLAGRLTCAWPLC